MSHLRLALSIAFLSVQAKTLLEAQAKSIITPSDIDISPELQQRLARQIADADNIDTDGVYGYVPRVVHGVNKIIKGLLNGSPHTVFHGAFGIAPEDVAEDLIGTYNQIMGIPDPEDLDLDETTEKTKPKPKPSKKPAVKPKPVAAAAAASTQGVAAEAPKKALAFPPKQKPLKAKEEEDNVEDDEDEEDDD